MIKAAGALRRRRSSDPRVSTPPGGDLAAGRRAAGARGRTGLAGIAANDRARYEAMLRNQRWAPLLDEVESALARPAARFHLDLQRYALAALEGLGEAHAEARRALLGELGGLLTRMPGLVELCDRDGCPSRTRRPVASSTPKCSALCPWTRRPGPSRRPRTRPRPRRSARCASRRPAGRSRRPPARAALKDVPRDILPGARRSPGRGRGRRSRPARRRRARGRARDLQAAVDRLAGPRARFVGRAALARLCVDAGLAPVARAIFADLAREAETRGLAAWEPALVAPVLEGLLRAGEPAGDERARIFAELAALDPGAAARLALAATTTAPAPALDARGRR
ncbi:MAG: type VI secretion system domain-containing protein [Myxococcales bacterium]|nr:type VI secretion system domain-containing protein [Myxococcales bacterium]